MNKWGKFGARKRKKKHCVNAIYLLLLLFEKGVKAKVYGER